MFYYPINSQKLTREAIAFYREYLVNHELVVEHLEIYGLPNPQLPQTRRLFQMMHDHFVYRPGRANFTRRELCEFFRWE